MNNLTAVPDPVTVVSRFIVDIEHPDNWNPEHDDVLAVLRTLAAGSPLDFLACECQEPFLAT